MACLPSNICTKSYWNWKLLLKVSLVVGWYPVFETPCTFTTVFVLIVPAILESLKIRLVLFCKIVHVCCTDSTKPLQFFCLFAYVYLVFITPDTFTVTA